MDIDDIEVRVVHGVAEGRIQHLTEHRPYQNEYKRELNTYERERDVMGNYKRKHADNAGTEPDTTAKDESYDRCAESQNRANNPTREHEQGKSLQTMNIFFDSGWERNM